MCWVVSMFGIWGLWIAGQPCAASECLAIFQVVLDSGFKSRLEPPAGCSDHHRTVHTQLRCATTCPVRAARLLLNPCLMALDEARVERQGRKWYFVFSRCLLSSRRRLHLNKTSKRMAKLETRLCFKRLKIKPNTADVQRDSQAKRGAVGRVGRWGSCRKSLTLRSGQ